MATTVDKLNGNLYEKYADKIVKLIPTNSILQEDFDFVKDKQTSGGAYHQPVILQHENGFTYAGPDEDAFPLNGSIAMTMKDAALLGSQIVLYSALGQNAVDRSLAPGAAFRSAQWLLMDDMMESISKRVEISLLYGETNIGTAITGANVNATTTTITLSDPSYAAGIWSGGVGTQISLFDSVTGAIANATGPLTVTAVNSQTRTLTVTGLAADITAVDALLAVGAPDAVINFYGARLTGNVYKEAAGLDKIITNTGVLFGIDAAVYDLWKGNVYNVGGNLTQAALDLGLAAAVDKGLQEDVNVYVSPTTWTFLNKELAALRMFDSSYKSTEGENGYNRITYKSQAGTQTIIAHPFVKRGEAFAVPPSHAIRVGAKEAGFTNLDRDAKTPVFTQKDQNFSYYTNVSSNQALLIDSPAKTVKFTGITNV